MGYPVLRRDLSVVHDSDELRDHFSLTAEDHELLKKIRSDSARLGCAVLLKTFQFLGHPPRRASHIPPAVVAWIAPQLGLEPEPFARYRWKGRLWDLHLALIREHGGWRPFDAKDREPLVSWLTGRCKDSLSLKELLRAAVEHCRHLRLELPREKELRRLVGAARRQFLHKLYEEVAGRIGSETLQQMERCLEPSESATTPYEWLKTPAGKLGRKTLREELDKLELLEKFRLERARHFAGVPERVFRLLKNRAQAEDAFQMRRHPAPRRATLLAAFLCARHMEVIDQVARMFLELVRKIENKGQEALEQEVAADLPRVFGKAQLLYKVVRAAKEQPEAQFGKAIVELIGEERFERLLAEAEGSSSTSYELARAEQLEKKYRSYRRTMAAVLRAIELRTNSPKQRALLRGVELIEKYATTKHTFLPAHESVPEELLSGPWREMVLEGGADGQRVRKRAFELCVLSKLKDALKCKEVWIQGAYRFRNPDEDLPADWESRREEHYRRRALPLDAAAFLDPLRQQMTQALEGLHRYFGRPGDGGVEIRHPGGGARGVFHVPKILKRPERPILLEIKEHVLERWGVLDLLDILLEADRQVDFARFFHTSGQRQVLGREEVRRRLLLVLYALGTNLGLKRIHAAAEPGCSYDDLRYFLSRFITLDGVRQSNIALVNRILALRNPRIWGRGTACASDGKHLGAWEQNSLTEWHPHYDRPGVMVYWHVEKNSTCIHSLLQSISSSQVASMLEGLVRHDTEMRVESNSVDSHGQSEVAFAFCRLLGFRLLPRLRRIREARLFVPDKEMASSLPRLAGVLAERRPIDWELIAEHYDEMVRHVVAVADGTGPVDSILRRFNRYNRSSPLYRAFIELGKAQKTIFLCEYLSQPALRLEIHDALQVVENWNSCVDFICFGRKAELASNDPFIQELMVLCVHLLQNAVVLSNTVMVERVMNEQKLLERMVPEDLRALTPLFTSNVNPYGDFELNLEKPSFLAVA